MKKFKRVTKCSKPVSFFMLLEMHAGASGPKGRIIQEILSKIKENQRKCKKNEEKLQKKCKRYQKIPKDTQILPKMYENSRKINEKHEKIEKKKKKKNYKRYRKIPNFPPNYKEKCAKKTKNIEKTLKTMEVQHYVIHMTQVQGI